MKKIILPFSLILLGLGANFVSAAPDSYDRRVDVSRLAADESQAYRGERSGRDEDWRDRRAGDDLARLNREVRQVRSLIGDSRRVGQRVRDRFHRVMRATDYLNDQFRRGGMRGGEIHRRADAIRADLDGIRRDMRGR